MRWVLILLERLASYGVAYVVLQILTGFEVGILAAGLAFTKQMTVPAALAATIVPVGVPLLLLQGTLFVAWKEGLLLFCTTDRKELLALKSRVRLSEKRSELFA